MGIEIPLIFLLFAFICLIIALLEERQEPEDEDAETRSSHLVIIVLLSSLIFFIVGGVCMNHVTALYYSGATDSVGEYYVESYRPLSYIGYGFSFLVGFFLILKVFDQIDLRTEDERG